MTLLRVYKICDKVLRFGSYLEDELSLELNRDSSDSGFITALSYGVIDKSLEFDYIISKLCPKPPKNAIKTIFKIGLYQLKYMNVAKYAAVDNTTELCKKIGKAQSAGFVNAVLKSFIDSNIELPGLAVKYSFPDWIVAKYLAQYKGEAENILAYKDEVLEHVRLLIDKEEFINLLNKNNIEYKPSVLDNALYCDYKKLLKSDIDKSFYTGQNLGSMLIINALKVGSNDKVLDCCASPGGKTVYIASYTKNEVLACDITDYKIKLIENYARRLKINNIAVKVSDAAVFNKELGVFDKVLCDVPCSGLGIVYSKPDIKLHRKFEDIKSLTAIQQKIIENCKNYVAGGGYLMYSTCTLLKEENEDVINKFLENNSNFKKVEEKVILPHIYKTEGFYYCLLRKTI